MTKALKMQLFFVIYSIFFRIKIQVAEDEKLSLLPCQSIGASPCAHKNALIFENGRLP